MLDTASTAPGKACCGNNREHPHGHWEESSTLNAFVTTTTGSSSPTSTVSAVSLSWQRQRLRGGETSTLRHRQWYRGSETYTEIPRKSGRRVSREAVASKGISHRAYMAEARAVAQRQRDSGFQGSIPHGGAGGANRGISHRAEASGGIFHSAEAHT